MTPLPPTGIVHKTFYKRSRWPTSSRPGSDVSLPPDPRVTPRRSTTAEGGNVAEAGPYCLDDGRHVQWEGSAPAFSLCGLGRRRGRGKGGPLPLPPEATRYTGRARTDDLLSQRGVSRSPTRARESGGRRRVLRPPRYPHPLRERLLRTGRGTTSPGSRPG